MHWRRQWQPTPALLPGESQGRQSLVGCRLSVRTESDTDWMCDLAAHPYMTTGKTIALITWTFVSKVLSLLLYMLSRFVIAVLPRSKHLLISRLQSPWSHHAIVCSDFGAPPRIKSVTVSLVAPSICQGVMGPDDLSFLNVEFQASFSTLFSPLPRGSLVPLRFLPLGWYHLRWWYFS